MLKEGFFRKPQERVIFKRFIMNEYKIFSFKPI